MASSMRFDPNRRSAPKATVGEVYLALTRDPWAEAKLGEIHYKVFVRGGMKRGAESGSEVPAHYVFVSPSDARVEVTEVSGWIKERFGEPAGTAPTTTPFGYLSQGNGGYRYDGWVMLFAAMLHGKDLDLAKYFTDAVASMPWTGFSSSARAAGMAPASGTVNAAWTGPVVKTPLFPGPRGRSAPASSGIPIVTPPPAGGGWLDRIFGAKPEPPSAASESPPAQVALSALEEDLDEEAAAKADAEFKARVEAEAEKRILEAYMVMARRERDEELLRQKHPEQFYSPSSARRGEPAREYAPPGYVEKEETQASRTRRKLQVDREARKAREEADLAEAAAVQARIDARAAEDARRALAERVDPDDLTKARSVKEELQRPAGSAPAFG